MQQLLLSVQLQKILLYQFQLLVITSYSIHYTKLYELLPGEYATLLAEVQKINGYDNEKFEELKEEVKRNNFV